MTAIQKILDNFKEVHEKLNRVLKWQAVHDKAHETVDRDISDLRETMYGNPGIRDKVVRLWACKKQLKGWREFWLGVLKYVISVGIAAVIIWLLSVYRAGG